MFQMANKNKCIECSMKLIQKEKKFCSQECREIYYKRKISNIQKKNNISNNVQILRMRSKINWFRKYEEDE